MSESVVVEFGSVSSKGWKLTVTVTMTCDHRQHHNHSVEVAEEMVQERKVSHTEPCQPTISEQWSLMVDLQCMALTV